MACLALAAAAPAGAIDDISIRPAAEAPVELLRPAPGEALVSGRESTIEWRARRDLSADGVFEWEAFLSYDGGRTWPVRATPHLDVSVSSFSFTIAMVPSDDVRIMLRFGDERREVGYVLPTVYRSVVPAGMLIRPWGPEPTLAVGETARPGVPGVVVWVDGARNGRRVVTRTTAWRPATASRPGSTGAPQWPFLAPPQPRALELADGYEAWDPTIRSGRAGVPLRSARLALPILLLLCRRNE